VTPYFGRKRGPRPVPLVSVPLDGPSTVTVRFVSVRADGRHHGLALLLRHGELGLAGRRAHGAGPISDHLLVWAEDGAEHQVACWPSSKPAELVIEGCYGAERVFGGAKAALVVSSNPHGGLVLRCSQRPDGLDLTDLVVELRITPGEPTARIPGPAAASPARVAPATVGTRELPAFRYHPDPITSGAFVPTERPCARCGQVRGWSYTGPIYTGRDDISEAVGSGEIAVCPWCLVDGSAAAEWSATFVDFDPDRPVDDATRQEIETRTPGFWYEYQPRWPVHHRQPCAYLHTVTAANFDTAPRDHQDAVRRTGVTLIRDPGARAAIDLIAVPDEFPGLPIFRCLHCATLIVHAG
jgi:uncharacterized protein CbrC (UPF0167 family)